MGLPTKVLRFVCVCVCMCVCVCVCLSPLCRYHVSIIKWLFAAQGLKCPVCLLEFDEEDEIKILPCKHQFHSQCIVTWLEKVTQELWQSVFEIYYLLCVYRKDMLGSFLWTIWCGILSSSHIHPHTCTHAYTYPHACAHRQSVFLSYIYIHIDSNLLPLFLWSCIFLFIMPWNVGIFDRQLTINFYLCAGVLLPSV